MSEIGTMLCDIAEGFAPAMGWCGARCEHGGICDLEPDHDGAHQARVEDDRVVCEWERRRDYETI